MDIYCPVCAEPWDNDCLHDAVDDGDFDSYNDSAGAFRKSGCKIFHTTHNETTVGSFRAQVSGVLMDLLDDDMDGVSAMMDDFEWLGMLE